MNVENIDQLFNSFKEKNVLIIGDAMIDSYMWGRVERMSPEAPVPVVEVDRYEDRLGGAANVARNISELEMHLNNNTHSLLIDHKTDGNGYP